AVVGDGELLGHGLEGNCRPFQGTRNTRHVLQELIKQRRGGWGQHKLVLAGHIHSSRPARDNPAIISNHNIPNRVIDPRSRTTDSTRNKILHLARSGPSRSELIAQLAHHIKGSIQHSLLALVVNILRNVLPLRRANRQLGKNRIHRLINEIRNLFLQPVLHSLRRYAATTARNESTIRPNRQVVMGTEIRIVSTSRTRPIFDHRWRTTGFNIDRSVLPYSPQRAGSVTTVSATISNTRGGRVSLQPGNKPLGAARVLTITPAVKRHSSPLSSTVTALNNASDTRHEARAVSAAATLSRA